jgi:hypothetical protein
MVGAGVLVTVNVACAISPTEKPVTSTVAVPIATLPTENVKGVNTPLARNVHAPAAVIRPAVGLEI